MKHIPNVFTLLNLFFGCIAIVFTLQTESVIIYFNDGFESSFNIPEKLTWAAVFIGLAALVDFLDGFVARLFNATSKLGEQLDSLADVVSFGVAPSMIVYQFLRMSFAKEESGVDVSVIWLMPALFIAAAGAYRLARFNLDNSQQYGFKGVPIPAVGLLLASLPMIYWNTENVTVINLLLNKWVLYALILAVCWLMVSKLPLMALKFKNLSVKNNISKIILIAFSITAILIFHWLSVPIIFIAYIILSLIFKNKN